MVFTLHSILISFTFNIIDIIDKTIYIFPFKGGGAPLPAVKLWGFDATMPRSHLGGLGGVGGLAEGGGAADPAVELGGGIDPGDPADVGWPLTVELQEVMLNQ